MIKDYDETKETNHVNPKLQTGRIYRFTSGKHEGRYFTSGGCSKEPHNPHKLNHIIYLATPKYLGGWDLEEDVFGDFAGKEGKLVQYIEVTFTEVYGG